jgi:BMFP domain-containing protein YqiC
LARARKEAQALAQHMTDLEAKQTMLNISADYERMAKRAEERAKRSPQPK